MQNRLTGQAADVALRLLPPETVHMLKVLATLRDCDVRASLRQLVHVHKGDLNAYRMATIEKVVTDARSGQLNRGPGLRTWQSMVAGKDAAAAAETVVEGILISKDQPFATYCDDVNAVLGHPPAVASGTKRWQP